MVHRAQPDPHSMTRFLAFFILAAVALGFGWRYAPEDIRGKVAEFIGVVQKRGEKEAKRFIEDVVLPDDPRERRRVLAEELQKNIEEIKRRHDLGSGKALGDMADSARSQATLEELIIASEEVLKELDAANADESFGAKAADRIFDAVFPKEKEVLDCSACVNR